MANKAKKAVKAKAAAKSLYGYNLPQVAGYTPSAAERKRAEAERREYERQNRRQNALHVVGQIYMGSGKPAAQILREADAFVAWLGQGARK